ncbi:hypothetical protein Leryth_026545 [Lithospermum erythrorhizon]|nr:hypothetical protein Leryth_026545 [Lithospermum erythrorhizon]
MWNVLQALLAAWKDACESTRHSEMVIPRGDFNVGRLKLEVVGLSYLTNALIQDITSLDAKMFHINVLGGKNVTFEHVTIKAPDESPNTDGIHIGRSYGVRVNNCPITTGDDCISIGDAVRGIFVKIGEASDIHFEDIQVTNVLNPIIIDQEYCPSGKCPNSVSHYILLRIIYLPLEQDPPSRVRISNVSFKNIKGTSASKEAVKIVCSKSVPCQGVEIGDIHLTYNGRDVLY